MEEGCKPVKLYFEHYIPTQCDAELPPIIFVHGIADSSGTWSKVLQQIADKTKRQAYAIDLRNHGRSEWNEYQSLDSFCQDIEHFMAETGIQKSALVSHSIGGKACMAICLRRPELVEKIVIEEAKLKDVTPKEIELLSSLTGMLRMINLLPKRMSENAVRTLIVNRAMQIYPNETDIHNAIHCMPVNKDSDGTYHLAFNIQALEKSVQDKNFLHIDLTKCQRYTGPTLVIYGAKSEMSVDKDETLPEYFPNAEFYRVEGGHNLHKQFEKEYVTKVCDFLNS